MQTPSGNSEDSSEEALMPARVPDSMVLITCHIFLGKSVPMDSTHPTPVLSKLHRSALIKALTYVLRKKRILSLWGELLIETYPQDGKTQWMWSSWGYQVLAAIILRRLTSIRESSAR